MQFEKLKHLEMLNSTLTLSHWWCLPFVFYVLIIALAPIYCKNWWNKLSNKLIITTSLTLSMCVFLIIFFNNLALQKIEHNIIEYMQFLILLAALFIVSGGINIRFNIQSTTNNNLKLLSFGAILSSLIGTLGASIVLIKPLLELNDKRNNKSHLIIFFILIVSNCGGLLTPLGDPPLYMGYLKGVPFFWTLRLFPYWFFINFYLLTLFYIIDRRQIGSKAIKQITARQKIELTGFLNIGLLLVIITTVALSPYFKELFFENNAISKSGSPLRELILVIIGLASLKFTNQSIRYKNGFTFEPINEIAILFFGLFILMIPVFEWLLINGSSFGFKSNTAFFLSSGVLSSFLDNTPTYLMFFCLGECFNSLDPTTYVGTTKISEHILVAISLGSVLMGGLTYLGNGPNLLIRNIAEKRGVQMPTFFKYLFLATIIMLPPLTAFCFFMTIS